MEIEKTGSAFMHACMYVIHNDLASRQALHSSTHSEILVPWTCAALKQLRAFSVIGPSTWNELPLTLRLLPQNNIVVSDYDVRHMYERLYDI